MNYQTIYNRSKTPFQSREVFVKLLCTHYVYVPLSDHLDFIESFVSFSLEPFLILLVLLNAALQSLQYLAIVSHLIECCLHFLSSISILLLVLFILLSTSVQLTLQRVQLIQQFLLML